MGIITRLYHRSDGLSENKYNVFFMDMGENIHIHYRDLRIELAVGEFLEFAELCEKYLPQVRKEIDGGYRDGVHPNTNQSNTLKTFTENKPLKRNVVYNPRRISLEENTDGYHIHIRNYKILLDKSSFLNFARAAKEALEVRERPIDLDETLSLIGINELTYQVDEAFHADGRQQARVTVPKAYFRKTIQVLEGLGYGKVSAAPEEAVYEKPEARVHLKVGTVTAEATALAPVPSAIVPLADFLETNGPRLSAKDLNLLKLQVLDFFEYVRKSDLKDVTDLDYRNLLYDTAKDKVIFPAKERGEPVDVDREWSRFYNFLHARNLGFVKPKKLFYSEEELKRLDTVFRDYVAKELAKHPCVSRIYLLNPMETKKAGSGTGRYEVPFLHIGWVKLGSDFDILIEIDERHPIPPDWTFKFFWKTCGSDYYHLDEVDFPIPSPYIEKFPNIRFRHHLVEAYLFFPSRSDKKTKDAYLAKFPYEILYERKETDEGALARQLGPFLAERYGLSVENIEPIQIFSFNKVFTVKAREGTFVAKIMKDAEFTPATEGHKGTHLDYEVTLLKGLSGKGLPVVVPVPGRDGKLDQTFDKRHCMLFPFIKAAANPLPQAERPAAAAHALARLHKELIRIEAGTEAYRFEESLDFWLKDFREFPAKFAPEDADLQGRFKTLVPAVNGARNRIQKAKDLPYLHGHGDVCPRNFFFTEKEAIIYDFQAAHHGPRIEDVAEGAQEFAQPGDRIEPALVEDFIAAYEAENPLGAEERQLLPAMLLLHAAVKLGRLLRMEVVFGNKVDRKRVSAHLEYAETLAARQPAAAAPLFRNVSVKVAKHPAP